MPVQTKTWRDYLGESDALYKRIKDVLSNPESSTEELGHVPEMKADADALKDRALKLREVIESGTDDVLREIEKKGTNTPNGQNGAHPDGYKRWGEFLYEVWEAGNPNIKKAPPPRLANAWFKDEAPTPSEEKAMSGDVGEAGGFLIPTEFDAQLRSVIGESSLVRSRATVVPMRRREIRMPVLDQTSTTAGQPHWFGGLHFYWEEEAGLKTESDPKFRQAALIARKLIGYTISSDELLDDSAISLEAFLSGPLGFAGGVAWVEDYCFLRGTGAGQPLGIVLAPATLVRTRALAGHIGFNDITDMLQHFLPSGRGVWLVSQSAMAEICRMTAPVGSASPQLVWVPNARDGIPGSIFGYPVLWTEKLPTLGVKGDIVLADLSYYLIGDRQATTVESTKFDRWRYDQTSWRVVHRVDGRPWLNAPLTLQDGTEQVSPFVELDSNAVSS